MRCLLPKQRWCFGRLPGWRCPPDEGAWRCWDPRAASIAGGEASCQLGAVRRA